MNEFSDVKSDDLFWWSIGGMFRIQMALYCSEISYWGQIKEVWHLVGNKRYLRYEISIKNDIWAIPFLRCEFERVGVIQLDEQIAWGKRHIDA